MTVDIEKMEALAKAAKSGGAEWSDLHVDTERMYTAEGMLVELYEFATPAVLLEMLASKALAEEARDLYLADKKRLLDELNDSRAEVAGLKTGYEAYERVNAELRAENKRLKTKLETVRCLFGSAVPSDEQLDIAIDAAMSKEQSHD
ncbi:hypothetical protein OQB66_08495 [Pseudomonas syringae]|uniref:hypothetical protein n=1 Tax=Pseudomonas syringae TaxID=317 RepID=UPI00224A919A|nr:hypothetical protein [Pseudomonas syringae]UZS74332.1 hypothetical protein OQB66_08495 [Pseudomonas syringae]